MKRCAVALLGLLATVPVQGSIITFVVYFQTTTGSPAPATATFSGDDVTQVFTNFTVNWNGITFDLTSSANAPTIGGTGCPGADSTPLYGFSILIQECSGATYQWNAATVSNGDSYFAFVETNSGNNFIFATVSLPGTPVAAASGTWFTTELPEPGTLEMLIGGGMLLIGVGLIRRKRPARTMRVSSSSPVRQVDG
jgi:hypothetical protein